MTINGDVDGLNAPLGLDDSPLGPNELKERLAELLGLRGDTMESIEVTLRAQDKMLQGQGSSQELGDTPHISHSAAHSASPLSRSSLDNSSPEPTAAAKEIKGPGSNAIVDIMKVDISEQESSCEADAGLHASMAGMRIGEEASQDMELCPWKMVLNYPDWFIGKANKPRARPYFDAFHAHQEWDFYYLHSTEKHAVGSLLFVPAEQFVKFLAIINSQLDTKLAVPGVHAKWYSYRFGEGNTPCPKYLGKVHDIESRACVLDLKALPAVGDEVLKYDAATSEARRNFSDRLEAIAKYAPKKKKSSSAKQARNRERRRHMMEMTQDALGLKPWETHAADSTNPGFDASKPPPVPHKNSPVFIAIDVEVHEFFHELVTELGIAILDTEKTKSVAPGETGRGWWPLMVSKHFRVKEYAYHCNHKYVKGCPERFNFGTSDIVTAGKLLETIDDIFVKYATWTSPTGEKTERDIVFVGHDVDSDARYLASFGCHMDTKKVIFRADTKDLHQHLSGADQGRALISVLGDFDIDSENLHNAGNDAVYTLRAAVACAVKGMKENIKPHGIENLANMGNMDNMANITNAENAAKVPEPEEEFEEDNVDKRDVTFVPGKIYHYAEEYYGSDGDDNLPMIL